MPGPFHLDSNRRSFLRASAVSALSGALILEAAVDTPVEIGIIGCGARGNYIGNFFTEHTGAKVVALADPLPERIESIKTNLHCPTAKGYTGIDGYRELLNSKLDAVVIESPPYFHPEQVKAAIAAGKHVFVAKPIAVDAPGCQIIADSAAQAQTKNLSLVVDFQTRARPVYQEAALRVHRGDIGKPLLAQIYYHSGDRIPYTTPEYVAPQSQDSPLQTRLRRWGRDMNLSGDIIVEQDIHMIDVANWFLGAHPEKASGTCTREAGTGRGILFVLQYTYPGGVQGDFAGSSFPHGFRDLCVRIFGTRGTADSHYLGAVNILGANAWKGTEADQTREGALTNVQNFVASIRSGKSIDNAAPAVESTLTAVLGRMAAYEQRTVTWDEMLRINQKLDPKLAG